MNFCMQTKCSVNSGQPTSQNLLGFEDFQKESQILIFLVLYYIISIVKTDLVENKYL